MPYQNFNKILPELQNCKFTDIFKTCYKRQTKWENLTILFLFLTDIHFIKINFIVVITGVIQLIPPVLSSETLLHILLSSEYSGFRPSTTAVVTQPVHT